MTNHNNNNNNNNNNNSNNNNIPLQPTIATIPPTFEAQNRRHRDDSVQQQQPTLFTSFFAAPTTTASSFYNTPTAPPPPPLQAQQPSLPPPFWMIHPPPLTTDGASNNVTRATTTPWLVATTTASHPSQQQQQQQQQQQYHNHHIDNRIFLQRQQQELRTLMANRHDTRQNNNSTGGVGNNNRESEEDGFDTIDFNNNNNNSTGILFDPTILNPTTATNITATTTTDTITANNSNNTNNQDDDNTSDNTDQATTGTTNNSIVMMNNDGSMTTLNEPRAIAIWRERERRQRTIRVFMMFLLMLLLMEEEPNNNRQNNNDKKNNNRLRGTSSYQNRNKNNSNSIGKYPKSLSHDVYTSRTVQDENLRLLCRSHPRYHSLIDKQRKLNNNQLKYKNNKDKTTATDNNISRKEQQQQDDEYDYNEHIMQYAISLSDMEKDEFDNDNDHHKDNKNSGSSSMTSGGAVISSSSSASLTSSSSSSGLLSSTNTKDPDNDYRKVLHYPWNTTGFYRGNWKRIVDTPSSSTKKVLKAIPISSTSSKVMYHQQNVRRLNINNNNNNNVTDDELLDYPMNYNKTYIDNASAIVNAVFDEDVQQNNNEILHGRIMTAANIATTLSIATSSSNEKAEQNNNLNSSVLTVKNANTNHTNSEHHQDDYVTAIEVEDLMLDILHHTKHEWFGVHILPNQYRLQTRDDNNLTASKYEDIRYDQNNNRIYPSVSSSKTIVSTTTTAHLRHTRHQQQQQQQQYVPDDVINNNNQMNVTLTRDNGRAAFQLFSRSIPGMKEISIVEGFIKLYDSTSPGYSTSKDLLLRVRGVLIHSIGRLSLTANADVSEAAFIMTPSSYLSDNDNNHHDNHDYDDADNVIISSTSSMKPRIIIRDDVTSTTHEEKEDERIMASKKQQQQKQLLKSSLLPTTMSYRQNKKDEQHRRRRLQEIIKKNLHGDDDNNSVPNMEEIRDAAIEYDDDFNEEILDRNSLVESTAINKNGYQFSFTTSDYDDDYDHNDGTIETSSVTEQPNEEEEEQQDLVDSDGGELMKSRLLQERIDELNELLQDTEANNIDNFTNIKEQNETITKTKYIPPWSDVIMPFPYVRDDDYETLRRTRTAAARLMPPRERALEKNAAHCLFEINMDIEPIEWTIGSWRTLLSHHIEDAKLLNPNAYNVDEEEELDIVNNNNSNNDNKDDEVSSVDQQLKQKDGSDVYTSRLGIRTAANGGERRRVESSSYQRTGISSKKFMQDQALVMNMIGDIRSPNCDFSAVLNVTALRTDWETTTSRAISYSFYMMLVCLTQILVLLRQLLHSQSSSTATRVSIICIGWQTVIDALLCLGHIYLSLAVQPLFTAFASVAFFKLLIFCVIEMKYMAIIIQSRSNNSSTNNAAQQQDVIRRQIPLMHLRFYVALMTVFIMLFYVTDKYRLPFMITLYSFWVPQIILNIITEAKAPMHKYYIYGMSVTRMFVPLYMLGLSGNFLKQVYPETPYDIYTCEILIIWISIQTALLIGQGKYGARFMIPSRFLPPKFDYSRPIPATMLPPGASTAILLYEQKAHSLTFAETMDDRCEAVNQTSSSTSINNTIMNNSNHNSSGKASMTTISSQSGARTVVPADEYEPIRREHHNTTAVTTRHRLRGNRINRNEGRSAMTMDNHRQTTSTNSEPSSPSRILESKKDNVKSIVSALSSRSSSVPVAELTPPSSPVPPSSCIMECSICYDDIDIRKRKEYMLAPCNHLFHRGCLSQWMDVKMECPICRTELPAL